MSFPQKAKLPKDFQVKFPLGAYVLAGRKNDNVIMVIERESQEIIDSIFIGGKFHKIYFSPDNRFAFVVNQQEKLLLVIDTQTFQTLK